MAAEQSLAIVLRAVEFSETSLIVTLLTRQLGRVSAIAKGARRPKGPFENSLDLLSVCRIVLLRKTSDSLDILTESKLQRRFRGGEKSLSRLYAGYYLAEMLRLMTEDHVPQDNLYDLATRTLGQIDGNACVPKALLCFDVQLMKRLGHAPGTQDCTGCGGIVSVGNHVAFSLSGGGIVCRTCQSKQQDILRIGATTLAWLRRLKDHPVDGPANSPVLNSDPFAPVRGTPPLTQREYGELRLLLNRYAEVIIGRKPRMQSFLPMKLDR